MASKPTTPSRMIDRVAEKAALKSESMSISDFFTALYDRIETHNTMTWAASLSFYTSLSLAPLLMLFVTVSSTFGAYFQRNFVDQVQNLMGADAAEAIELVIDNAQARPDLVSISGIIGVVTLLLSASLVFGELRAALTKIFDREAPAPAKMTFLKSIMNFAKERIFQMGLVFGFIFTMLVSLGISTAISAVLGISGESSEVFTFSLMNVGISVVIYIAIFTLLFHYLPRRRLPWRQAIRGGLFTAFLFVAGKEVIGAYLGNSGISSAYGAAGSIIVLLAWVYYSALITFIGAHVSCIFPSDKANKVLASSATASGTLN